MGWTSLLNFASARGDKEPNATAGRSNPLIAGSSGQPSYSNPYIRITFEHSKPELAVEVKLLRVLGDNGRRFWTPDTARGCLGRRR